MKTIVECDKCGKSRLEMDYDDKCPHGKIKDTQECLLCYPDMSWASQPLTREEFNKIYASNWTHSWPERNSPYPMQYRWTPLMPKLLEEYGRLKGWL